MRATVLHAARDIRLDEVPDPVIAVPSDAIVRVVAACVCGSDLWPYRGITPTEKPKRIGHEFVGVVEEKGRDVTGIAVGDTVIAPFYHCDGSCVNCRNGVSTSCVEGGWWGADDRDGHFADGGQGEYVRVPHAAGTLTVVPGPVDAALIPSLLTLSDVFGTGHHAAVSAGVRPGATVAVVGDGAVGLSGVLAAVRLGASRVVAMSRHEDRQRLAREFGATDVVAERGQEGIDRLADMFDGIGPDCVLECVGTKESMDQALRSARPGGQVGFVGVPNGGPELPVRTMFATNVGVRGGVAPVRGYVAELLPEVLDGSLTPGKVFTRELPLDDIAEAYRLMDEREEIKVLVRP
ncbi:zinc-dependent alcohol dehydrogenase family protein [Mycetocola reblochoni]|uniref:Threonine dehydrogenase and related Zn-dependent dehydrogenases n=2 Tax=Mycetocola reblochoni TaxID=331618 RepID=A0A1R4JW34_9MICO|nr:zinc-dependent alcohol dehydrogenase family protein [Mycetocola reblochoni]RLP70644.1 IMP dehydrogenase [Mycetocola reblochoni]SJN36188.1 Threonine dehydrogenase and related Zn-dependent dehydrogenases [Mycetocola reblochoni REB411]